jgi:exosortase
LVVQWGQDADMGHGFFVLPVAALIAWQRRDQLQRLQPEPSWWGLGVLLWAAMQMVVAEIGADLFLGRTAFVISIAGSILLLAGSRYLRVLAFPIGLLLFMISVPGVIYNQITLPLQLLASSAGALLIRLVGVPAERLGNVLIVNGQQLLVAEACSGIRSLLALGFVGSAYGAFTEHSAKVRIALAAATLPIALAANAVRVATTGVLANWRPALAQGFAHEASGWMIFVIALGMILGLHPLLRRLLVRGAPSPDGAPH